MTPIRVALADDHAIVLDGLRRLFDAEPDIQVVQTFTTGAAAAAEAPLLNLDVLVLDLRMPDTNGLEVLARLAKDGTRCRTVLLSAAVSDDDAVEALRMGVCGIVLKESPPDSLLECVRAVSRGERWIDSETRTRAAELVARREVAAANLSEVLTARETEIVRMIARGLRNKAIAERLEISEGTVKIHLHNVYEKLGLDGRLELMLYAQKSGLS